MVFPELNYVFLIFGFPFVFPYLFTRYCTSRGRSFSSPEPTILLALGRNRELWEQPFQACAIDADCVKPDGQNSVISFVISKWLLPELSIPTAGLKDRRLWERECERERERERAR